jgi:hypothetical protein
MNARVTAEHFWARVDKSAGPKGCWPWTGGLDGKGYGNTSWRVDGRSLTLTAHQLAFWLAKGWRASERGLEVRHRCDNPPCCNPRHLIEGSHADNMRDMAKRGRSRKGSTQPSSQGVAHPGHRLTDDCVRDIRTRVAAGEQYRPLGKEFGVSHALIGHIVQRKAWRHIA